MSLILCGECARHVRAPATACPFCGASIAATVERAQAPRRSRAARIIGVAAISVACGGTTTSPNDSGTSDATDDHAALPMYGGGPFPEAGPLDASTDAGKSDASDASDDAPDADASGIALYGAPPPPDGGT